MGLFNWGKKRIIQQKIDLLRLQTEKLKLKNSLGLEKSKKKSKVVSEFLKNADDLAVLKEQLGADNNPIIEFLNTPTGQIAVKFLISKIGGGSGAKAASNIESFLAAATPMQKARGMALFNEILENEA